TWEFVSLAQGIPGRTPSSAGNLLRNSLQRGFRGLGWMWFAVVGGLALAILLARAFVGPRSEERAYARRALAFLLVATAIVVATSFFFRTGWSPYVPRRTGFARLLQVALLLVPIGAGVPLGVLPFGASAAVKRRFTLVAGAIGLAFALFVTVHGQPALDA